MTLPLTQILLTQVGTESTLKKATQHPFLLSAGKLDLTATSLQAWLTQDRLYALCGYAPFLGILISKCPAPAAGPLDSASKLHRKRLTVLAGAMANIDREVGFFEDVAKDNKLNLNVAKDTGLGLLNETTRGYIDYMVATVSKGSFEEGLILLWAMEKLYLDAWTYASTHLPSPIPSSVEPGSRRALLSLIPNWSSPEFKKFVDDIGELVNEIDTSRDPELEQRLIQVWKTTLWYEERFWQAGEI